MKVLAGIDGSHRSYQALSFVERLLAPEMTEMILYFSVPGLRWAPPPTVDESVREMARQSLAEAVFAKAREYIAEQFWPRITTVANSDPPAQGILKLATDRDVDLIVIGGHAATRRLTFWVGGTAREIVHQASKPLLVVRGEHLPTENVNVMLACGDQPLWQEAGTILAELNWPPQTNFTLLHVVETMDESYLEQLARGHHPSVPNAAALLAEYRQAVGRQRESFANRLRGVLDRMPQLIRHATQEVAQGHVVEKICEHVRRDAIDLTVVGARRLGQIRRLFGSTTEGLLIQCPCSLLIVHQPGPDQPGPPGH